MKLMSSFLCCSFFPVVEFLILFQRTTLYKGKGSVGVGRAQRDTSEERQTTSDPALEQNGPLLDCSLWIEDFAAFSCCPAAFDFEGRQTPAALLTGHLRRKKTTTQLAGELSSQHTQLSLSLIHIQMCIRDSVQMTEEVCVIFW